MAHAITTSISFTYGQLEVLRDALEEQVAYEHAILLSNPDDRTRLEQAETALNKVEKALKKNGGEQYAAGYYRGFTEKSLTSS